MRKAKNGRHRTVREKSFRGAALPGISVGKLDSVLGIGRAREETQTASFVKGTHSAGKNRVGSGLALWPQK